MAHVAFRLSTTLLVVINIQLVLPSSSSFNFVCSLSFFFFSFSFLFFLSVVQTTAAPSPWSFCFVWFLQSYFVCVLTPHVQTLIFELMSIRHQQQIKGPTNQNFKLYFIGLCVVYGLRPTSQNFELYFISLCLVHG